MTVLPDCVPLKKCSTCQATKPLTEFGIRKSNHDGRQGKCKQCLQLCVDNWKASNPVRYLCSTMLSAAKRRAKENNRICTITLGDVLTLYTPTCPVLDIPLRWEYRHGAPLSDASPTLDRINNIHGYTPGNVAIVSHAANFMKRNFTLAQIRRMHEWMERSTYLTCPVKRPNFICPPSSHC